MPSLELEVGAHLPDVRLTLERRGGRYTLRKEQIYSTTALPDWSTEAGAPPVIVLDLHRTLTPALGFPMEPPFPGVKEALDRWAAQNCILAIATAGLSPLHAPLVLDARRRTAAAWCREFGLPINLITGKVNAHLYYDDRMVPVAGGTADPWKAVVPAVEAQLKKRAELDQNGMWRLIALPDVGDEIEDYPEEGEVPEDAPRGHSGPVFNVDIHRTIVKSNSSTMESGLRPGAQLGVNTIYDLGYTVMPSCAGWDPATHKKAIAGERLRGLQRTLRTNGVKYDEIAAKLHGTVFVDDKGIQHTDWKKDLPTIIARMAKPHPTDEVTTGSPVAA